MFYWTGTVSPPPSGAAAAVGSAWQVLAAGLDWLSRTLSFGRLADQLSARVSALTEGGEGMETVAIGALLIGLFMVLRRRHALRNLMGPSPAPIPVVPGGLAPQEAPSAAVAAAEATARAVAGAPAEREAMMAARLRRMEGIRGVPAAAAPTDALHIAGAGEGTHTPPVVEQPPVSALHRPSHYPLNFMFGLRPEFA